MGKAISRTTGGCNLGVTMAIAALAVVLALTLVVVVETTATTSDRGGADPAMSAEVKGRSSVKYDPYIDRHAEVVQRLGGGRLN
jgi:hypothetical protein